jgi:hypothetical protein
MWMFSVILVTGSDGISGVYFEDSEVDMLSGQHETDTFAEDSTGLSR